MTPTECDILFGWHDNAIESKDMLNYITLVAKYYTGFSISFGVDGLNIKVGGRRSEFHRHETLGGGGGGEVLGSCPQRPPKKFKI